jgi:type IV pilus assembly protein PilC
MEFLCRVGTPDGRVLEEIRLARDERTARTDLERAGYRVFEIRRRGLRLSLPSVRLGRRAIPLRELLFFNQELAGLLHAGLPLLHALGMLIERQRNPELKEVLIDVHEKVRSGEELSDAFRAQGDRFPPLYASTLHAGERSGELEQVIRRFIRYLRLMLDVRKRIVSALVYPTLLVILSATMIAVMMVVVIPRFEIFYDAMDVELPVLTQGILSVSLFLKRWAALLFAGLVAAVVAGRYWSRTPVGSRQVDAIKLRLPLAGAILHRFSIAELCRSLSTLLAGGLPLVQSLQVATTSVGNAHLRAKLEPVVSKVREGQALYEALEETRVVPDLTIDLVKVGEATGSLDEMLGNVADFFDEEIETRIQRLLSLVEPMMLVFMGLIVSLLLIAMYLPLFSVLGKLQ